MLRLSVPLPSTDAECYNRSFSSGHLCFPLFFWIFLSGFLSPLPFVFCAILSLECCFSFVVRRLPLFPVSGHEGFDSWHLRCANKVVALLVAVCRLYTVDGSIFVNSRIFS